MADIFLIIFSITLVVDSINLFVSFIEFLILKWVGDIVKYDSEESLVFTQFAFKSSTFKR